MSAESDPRPDGRPARHVLILGGTTEARRLAEALAAAPRAG